MKNVNYIERWYINKLLYKEKKVTKDFTPPETTDETVYKLMHKVESVLVLYRFFVPRDNVFSKGINECIKALYGNQQKSTIKSLCLKYLLKKRFPEKEYIESMKNSYYIFWGMMKTIFNDHTDFNDIVKKKYQMAAFPPGTHVSGIPYHGPSQPPKNSAEKTPNKQSKEKS